MSRDKFEEWARTKGFDLDEWDGDFESLLTIAAYQGWLGGRESMRDEAIQKLAEFDANKCAQIVAGIEL